MAYNFEAQMDFGERRPLTGIRALKHPLVVMAHLGFRFGAIAFYVLASFFSASFIIQFLILLSLHSADLWAVKNVTGRLMVGLRWWSLVDADGKNHWKFEISQDPEKYDAFERQIFWAALVAAPFFWVLLVCTAFLTLQWQWMLSLHSADLWAVKNVTGRLMVGLRWWSLVDADGKNHWKFEISQDSEKYDAFERQIFWAALVAAPFFWALLVCTAFLTLQWQWMVVATIGAGMTATNLYGYLRCKWSSTQEMTNHFTRWAFFSMLRRNFAQQQQQPSPMATQQQRQPSPRLQEIV
uniref:Golgi apparatus membrane protein TVP23 homolog n=1 Tax=Globodera pallida TaxID=36090 RepID=A0A183BWS6_GLOPA